ncbi:Hypothetical predicted protein [Lecanosticta acicola]|uniref:Uncharacterized protein n=1 Tax=Lecanosticta acicola TaxID=111012 RepID=A0AAI8YXL6_9PEZI|nr:Hypothetical predicted protein [Lecanosticta acicola]
MLGDCSTRVTVALATPVRPDILGQRLEDYEKVIPTLRTLRLCHRFGRGTDVHVTKLPAELELAIEACVVRSSQHFYSERIRAFRHYEGRCAPMDHLPDCASPLEDQVGDQDLEKCENCEDIYWEPENCKNICDSTSEDLCWYCSQQPDPQNCGRTCMAKQRHAMNALASDWDYDMRDPCAELDWGRMIDSSPSGAFARCARICYLTATKQVLRKKKYEMSEEEFECGGAILRGMQTIISPKRLGTTVESEIRKRFKRALQVLCLEPYVHPSQQHTFLDRGDGNKSDDAVHPAQGSQKHRAEEWPKQVFLMETKADYTFEL